MKRFIIERNLPGMGSKSAAELRDAAAASNSVLDELAPKIQWHHSYVAGNKTFCVYLAEDESIIRQHAEMSGFPADLITEVVGIIDPTTATS